MADVEVVEIEDCFVRRESESGKALLMQMPDMDEVWIPKSQIHEDSEVWKEGDAGTLVVTKWIATQKQIVGHGTVRYVGP